MPNSAIGVQERRQMGRLQQNAHLALLHAGGLPLPNESGGPAVRKVRAEPAKPKRKLSAAARKSRRCGSQTVAGYSQGGSQEDQASGKGGIGYTCCLVSGISIKLQALTDRTETGHTPTMTLNSAALLALVGMSLLTIVLGIGFV